MGDRERKDASVAGDESFDIGALPPLMQNLLLAALRDPVRRPLALKRIAEWRERQKSDRADRAATPDGTAKSDKKSDAAFEMKKGQSLADAKLSGEHTTTKTTRDGDTTDTEQHKTSATLDKDGFALSHSASDAQDAGESAGVKSEHSVGAKVDGHSAHLTGGYGVEGKSDGETHKESLDGALGIKNGELDAELTAKQSTEKGGKTREATRTVGIEGDKVKAGWGHSKEEADKSSHGSDVGVTLGEHSAGVDYGTSSKSADGTSTKTSVGADFDSEKGSASVHAGQTIKDKEGNSTSAKLTAGSVAHAEEPVKENGRWVVRYEKSESIGGSVGKGKGPAAGNFGASRESFDKGTRSFATPEQAKEFQEKVNLGLDVEPDATSVGGAMQMGVGESQTHGDASGLSGGVSAGFEGATGGVSGHEKSTEEVEITRVSETVFDVTAKTSIDHGHDFSGGGSVVTAKRGESSQSGGLTTVRFDLSTREGKQAFEQFCRDKKVPARGGKVIATEGTEGHERHDGVDVALLGSAEYKSHTSEKVRNDDKGKHETYEGDQSHDNSPGWVGKHVFGEDKKHSSVEIESRQENDKDDGYTLTGNVSGDSGGYNRGKMQHLTGRDENWDEKKVQRSGEWTLVSDVDKKTIDSIEKYSDRFKGAKTNDDKMRQLGQWVADDGADAVESIQRWGGKDLQWDVELKGDSTFPGRAGRLELEKRIHGYAEALAQGNGSNAPTIAPEVNAEIALLQMRHDKVKTPSNYSDLPDSLRQQQLTLIERQIASLQSIEHRALVEGSKNTAGEKGVAIAERAANPEGYAKLPPDEQPVAKLRDAIANKDAAIAGNQANSAQAEPALIKAQQHTDWSKPNAGARAGAVSKQLAAARARDQAQRAEYLQLDAMRMELLKHGGDPQQALAVAQALDRALQKSVEESADALGRYDDAAHAQVLITKPAGFVGHEAFWNEIREDMTDAEYLPDVVDDDGGGTRDSDADDDDKNKPRARTNMKL